MTAIRRRTSACRVVRRLLASLLALVLLAPAALAGDVVVPARVQAQGDVTSSDYGQVIDVTYPTAPGTTYQDDYDEARGGGRVHRATDVFGAIGERVYAMRAGEIVWMPGDDPPDKHATAGYGIQVRGTDGRVYAYYHLGPDDGGPAQAFASGLSRGDQVERGQHIGYLGDSGNAAGGSPHLHVEIHDGTVTDPYGTNRINPYPSLQDAEARGDYPAGAGQSPAPEPPDGGAGTEPHVDRVAGSDRVLTAIALSQEVFSTADHVVLASGDSFADSVTAGPLAAVAGGPVLATRTNRLEPAVVAELVRLEATRVTIVGGTAAVPEQVERDLVVDAALLPSRIERLGGPTRYETAVAVAHQVWAATGSDAAGVALGEHPQEHRAWPDALAAGYHGAVTGAPVLLVAPERVPEPTAAAVAGVGSITVVGGTAAVSEGVAVDLDGFAGQVRRLAGPDRYLTAAAVAGDLAPDRVSLRRVWAATGHSFADALAASAAVAAAGETLLLVDGRARGGDERLGAWLRERADAVDSGRVVGGVAAVSEEARLLLGARIAPAGS